MRLTISEKYHFCHFLPKFGLNVSSKYPHRVLPEFLFEIDQKDKDF